MVHVGQMPRLRAVGPKDWELAADFEFMGVRVPKGFWTDGASGAIDRWTGHGGPAYVCHDWFYYRLNIGRPDPIAPTRRAADRWFLKALQALGVKPLVRLMMFAAVRVLGGKFLKQFFVR